MSDERWLEIERDIQSAVLHFASAVRLYDEPALRDDVWEGYKARMSLLHAMQAGHTSLEAALLRIFDMRGEQRPSGESWHMDLIRRAAVQTEARPPVLSAGIAKSADRTRRFRHVAVRTYDQFEPDEAEGAVKAAGHLAAELAEAIARFRGLTETG